MVGTIVMLGVAPKDYIAAAAACVEAASWGDLLILIVFVPFIHLHKTICKHLGQV